jgi:flagellar motility protein MotE (MotC chaperone)
MASADSVSSPGDQTGDALTDEPPAQTAEAADVPDSLSDEVADQEAVEDPAIAQENYQKLAQIFSVMDAGQAAAVLVQLEDSQIEGILRVMQGRAVAPILEEMDPERVASISRQVLGPGGPR